jgi:RNA polymerase sigma-70 factor (ECF subfamily)
MKNRKHGGPADDARFESVYRQYYARVWRNYRRNGISDDESHDLAQDAFHRLYERMGEIRGPDVWPFLKSIAHTVLLNYIRARHALKRSAKLVEIDDPETHEELPRTPEPDHAGQEQMTLRRTGLYREIDVLPEGQKQVVLLQLQGQSYEEMAATLRISMDAVKSRRRDALRQLKSRLREEPGGVEWPGGDPEEER